MAMNYEKKNVSMAQLFADGEEEEFVILSVSGDGNDDNSDLDLSLSLWEFVDVPECDQHDEPRSEEEKISEKKDREIQLESETETETETNTIEDRPPEESSPLLIQEASDHREEDADRDRALGLNDDLVPWNVSDKFGNQRLKKLGMRGVHAPKRSSHSATKRGGSKGKRGSGSKRGY